MKRWIIPFLCIAPAQYRPLVSTSIIPFLLFTLCKITLLSEVPHCIFLPPLRPPFPSFNTSISFRPCLLPRPPFWLPMSCGLRREFHCPGVWPSPLFVLFLSSFTLPTKRRPPFFSSIQPGIVLLVIMLNRMPVLYVVRSSK